MNDNATTDSEKETVSPVTEAPAEVVEELEKEGAHASSTERPYRKTQRGYVTSDKMDKTIVVEVEERVKHARYGKVTTKSNKFKAHDEENSAGIGDRVLIMETRPLAATKQWRLVEILEKAK
jgi:small subunit ribosomal protein S17